MDRKVIINADAFGLCEAVNKAVAQAHTDGVLTSATIMANMPAAEQAAQIAGQLPTLGVGVHLNLSKGRPLSLNTRVDCLRNTEGRFAYSLYILSLLSIPAHKIRNAIRIELSAQIQWVIDRGRKPTHLDSHEHIHTFPAIFPIVCELARRFEIPALRWTFEPKRVSTMPWPLPSQSGRKTAATLRTMAKINRLQNPHLLKTDCFLGVAHTGKIDVNFFKAVTLYNPAQTAEVMVQPRFADGPDTEQTESLPRRKDQLQALCSERTKQYFKDAQIELVHYGKL